ncbi:LPD7 domain-containing protein [Dongshaea marina]|uniref:LPD7 domain-containing protein n=1 Tax=Dongshaea marina TaxID=2047966 RepID=UPI00131EF56D|nr:LPD7 domain-containing protein [Dongshaea marina]
MKQARLREQSSQHYIEPLTGEYKAGSKAHQTLEQWHTQRAFEVRYINARNRAHYNTLLPQERVAFLDQKRGQHHAGPASIDDHLRAAGDNLRTAGEHLHDAQRNYRGSEPGIRKLIDRRTGRALRTLVQRYTGHQRAPASIRERSLASDSLGQYAIEFQEYQNGQLAEVDIKQIKQELDPEQLLVSLEQSHGVMPNKYGISTALDGSPRIQCGSRNLNVGDFLTKELHLPWAEAKQILEQEYARQQGRDFAPISPCERDHFEKQWRPTIEQARKKAWQQQMAFERQYRQQSKLELKQRKSAIYADNTIIGSEKRVALSIARMNKVIADINLDRMKKEGRFEIEVRYPKSMQKQYQSYQSRHKEKDDMAKGKLIEHGYAPYNHIEGESKSYFATLQDRLGRETTCWGVGIPDALAENKIKTGDIIDLKVNGTERVTVQSNIRDDQGKVIDKKWIDTDRKKWVVDKIEQVSSEKKFSQEQINNSIEASRVLYNTKEMKTLGVSPKDVVKTENGERFTYKDQQLTPIEMYKIAKNIPEEQAVKEVSDLYKVQLADEEKLNAYVNKENEVKSDNENDSIAQLKHQDDEVSKNTPPLPPQDFENITHKVNKEGHVSYYLQKEKIMVDRGKDVLIKKNEDVAVELGLRMAIEKFGKEVNIKGDKLYQDKVVEVAVKNNIDVTFDDPKLNEQYAKLKAAMVRGENIIEKSRIKHQEQEMNQKKQEKGQEKEPVTPPPQTRANEMIEQANQFIRQEPVKAPDMEL